MNRDSWTYKKLGDIAEIVGGSTPKTNVEEYWDGDNYWVTPAEIGESVFVNKTNRTITESAVKSCHLSLLPVGTVLLSSRAPIGKLGITTVPMYCNQGFKNIICSETLHNKYVYYYLSNNVPYIQSLGRGATFKEVSKKIVEEIAIPVPPKDIQIKIALELDTLNDSITLLQQQLTDLDELAMSIFYDMFGDPLLNPMAWPIKKIGDIGNVERGAGISKKDFVDSGLPCIHYGQLHTSFGPTAYKNITFIPSDLLPKYKIAHTGDVIMAITSEDVEGSCKSTAWLGDFDLVVGSDAAIYHHSINGVYVSYYTMTKAFYIEKEKYAKGFKVTHISAKEIESIPIPIPPMELQENFAQKVAAIEDSKATLNVQIKELQNLLAARMQYWFD